MTPDVSTWTKKRITRISGGEPEELLDQVVTERPLTIVVNHVEFATLMCTPEYLDELALGFLWSSGLIDPWDPGGLPALEVDERFGTASVSLPDVVLPIGIRRVVNSGCGSGIQPGSSDAASMFHDGATPAGGYPGLAFDSRDISAACSELLRGNSLFAQTGGAHAAALWIAGESPGEHVLVIREDIGRHNAVDKIGGYMLKGGVDAGRSFLAVTGRLSSDLVQKSVAFGFRVIVSRGAPTDAAVRLAVEADMTLVGFCRGDRMNIYSAPHRIATSPISSAGTIPGAAAPKP